MHFPRCFLQTPINGFFAVWFHRSFPLRCEFYQTIISHDGAYKVSAKSPITFPSRFWCWKYKSPRYGSIAQSVEQSSFPRKLCLRNHVAKPTEFRRPSLSHTILAHTVPRIYMYVLIYIHIPSGRPQLHTHWPIHASRSTRFDSRSVVPIFQPSCATAIDTDQNTHTHTRDVIRKYEEYVAQVQFVFFYNRTNATLCCINRIAW